MAHLHCRRRTRTQTPVLYRNTESEPVQGEHVLHNTMKPSAMEFKSKSVSESVSVNVNES